MSSESPRISAFPRHGQRSDPSRGRRVVTIALVALFATGIWWVILHFGARALGTPISAAWMLSVLGGIYVLLVLGLSMAAVAARRVSPAARDDGIVASPRRKAG